MSVRTHSLLIIYSLFFVPSIHAQQSSIDSLRALLPELKDDVRRVEILTELSTAYRTRNLEEAESCGQKAVALAEELRIPRLLARAYLELGWVQEAMKRNAQAARSFRAAGSFAREVNDGRITASSLRGLGNVEYNRGKLNEALPRYREALRLFRKIGDESGAAQALADIGSIHRFRGEYDTALAIFEQCLQLGTKLGDIAVIARSHGNIGNIHRGQSRYDQAKQDFQLSMQLFASIRDTAGIAITLHQLGSIELVQGRFERAHELFQQSLRLYKRLGDASGTAVVLTYLGHLHNIQGRYEQALSTYRRSLAINDSLGSKSLVIGSLLSIGNILYQQSSYARALDAFQRGLTLSEELGLKGLMASALIHIGRIHMKQGREAQALEKFQQATDLWAELDDDGAIAVGLYHIADIYTEQQKYRDALAYYARARDAFERNGESQQVALTLQRIGAILMDQGKYASALPPLRRSLAIREDLGEQSGIAEVLTNIGKIHVKQGRYDSAIVYGTRAYRIAGKIGAVEQLMDASKALSEAYAAKRDFPRAYEYHLAYTAQRDSLFNTENVRSINEMAAKYETEQREQKITLLEKEQQLQAALLERETFTRNAFIAGVVLLLLLSGLLTHRYLYRKRTSEQLSITLTQLKQTQAQLIHAEKMVTLGEMTAGLAHEIKNPLNFVTNFSDVATEMLSDLEHATDEETRASITVELRENLGRIREHGLRADTIIKGMMQHARGVAGERVRVDVNAVVEEAVQLAYQGMLALHGSADVALIRNYSPQELGAHLVPQEIGRVVLNLVNNAIYAVRVRPPVPATDAAATESTASDAIPLPSSAHAPGEPPTVWISTALRGGIIEIRVRDNGPGIPPIIQQKIFQPFFTTKPTGEGTGLGLSMSYDIIVNGHSGTIRCESSGTGAEFVIELPA